MGYLPGKLSSEYAMARRHELGAGLLVALGVALLFTGLAPYGVALVGIGAFSALWSLHSYARSRGTVKSPPPMPPSVKVQQRTL